jgi:hypothetical protein
MERTNYAIGARCTAGLRRHFMTDAYARAGVNIDAGNETVER